LDAPYKASKPHDVNTMEDEFKDSTLTAAGERAPWANSLESQLNEDTIWYMLKNMPFKDIRAMLQHAPELRELYLNDNNYNRFLNIAKKRFQSTPGLFSRFQEDNDDDRFVLSGRDSPPACLALIHRAIFYETVLMHKIPENWESSLATTVGPGRTRLMKMFPDMY